MDLDLQVMDQRTKLTGRNTKVSIDKLDRSLHTDNYHDK